MKLRGASFKESAIRAVTRLSERDNLLNLAQGFMDDDTLPQMRELALEAIREQTHQYTYPRGAPRLREALAHKLRQYNSITADPERNIIVTCGATEGALAALLSLGAGSEVLTFAPFYENFRLQTRCAGLSLRALELTEPGYSIDPETLERAVSPETSAIIFSNPCNPTGRVYSRQELEVIADCARRHDLVIICDETYERLTWGGRKHVSIGSLPAAAARTATVTSLGKTFSVTGWRVGYVVASGELADSISAIHDALTLTAPHPFQIALARALTGIDEIAELLRSELWERYKLLRDALDGAGFECREPEGGYFLWCQYRNISAKPDVEFCADLASNVGIAAVPGVVFYPQPGPPRFRVRFTFSKNRPTLAAAAARLASLQARESA